MSEYQKDTVGWHLNRLKEPLKSRALKGFAANPVHGSDEMVFTGVKGVLWRFIHSTTDEGAAFWEGAAGFFDGATPDGPTDTYYLYGWDMAKECAPDPETEKAGSPPGKSVGSKFPLLPSEVFPAPKKIPPISGGVIDPQGPMKKHIRTIEKRHDDEIKDLQARVSTLEGQLSENNALMQKLVKLLEGEPSPEPSV